MVDEAADVVAGDDVGDVAGDHELALLKDRHLIAEVVELAQDVGRDHDGDAAGAGLGQDRAQVAATTRVEAVGRLVEDEQARTVQEAASDEQALAHALRQRAARGVTLVAEIEGRQHVLDGWLEHVAGKFETLAEEAQVFRRRHVFVERIAVAQKADLAPQGGLVGARGLTVEGDAARARAQHRRQHAQRGRLAGAVGPDEAEDRAAGDRQGQAAHGPALAVVGLSEVTKLDAHGRRLP